MAFDIWRPLYIDNFDYDKYLYHYTNIETAIKIIYTNNLLFSSISKTNDTSESKLKIVFEQKNVTDKDKYKETVDEISEYFNKNTQIVQLLCFSMDAKLCKRDREKYISSMGTKDRYYDVSGRGFALPRMWAQYANNNEGVCFIFNRKKLIELIERKIAFTKCAPVRYEKFFNRYVIDAERMDILYDKISMVANGSLTLLDMIQKDDDFLTYNFFEK